MVKHIILWQLKDEYSDAEKADIKAGIKAGLEGTGFLFIAKDALMEKISQYRSFVILPTVSADNGPRLLISAVLP